MFGRPAPKYALAVVYDLVELGRKFWIMFCILSELILIDLWGGGGGVLSPIPRHGSGIVFQNYRRIILEVYVPWSKFVVFLTAFLEHIGALLEAIGVFQ